MTTENQELDEQTKQIVYDTIKNNTTTIYVVWLTIKTRGKGLTKWYLLISYLLVCYGINFMQFPLILLFAPIVLLIFFVMLYFVDMYLIIQSLLKVQTILSQEYNVIIDIDTLNKCFAWYSYEKKEDN